MAPSEILSRDLSERWRSLVAYSVGLAVYIVVVVAVYPAFKTSTSLDQLTSDNPGLAALFGISGSIISPSGWLSANIYANFFPLVILLLTIGYGAGCLAGQEESGYLELVLTLPFARRTVVAQKMAALVLQAGVLAVVVFVTVASGRAFQLTFSTATVAATTAAVTIMAVDFGLLAMAVGAFTGSRGLAVGVPTALAAASYLVSSLSPVVSGIAPARYLSLFYWSVGDNQLDNGVTVLGLAVLIAVALSAVIAVIALFDRHDLRA